MPTKLTLNEYVQRVNQKHSNKYDYSNSVYFGMASQILIVCPIHGEFSQLASNHMVGKGCPKCKNNVTSVRCKHSTSDFISKAIKIHGDTYEYTKVKYIKDNTEVIIICKEHGAFAQIARSHLSGCGCPRCAGWLGRES